eukprot:SAG22_NODE_1281_length_4896_cov_2.097353_3_plen_965_part_00
MLCWAAQAEIEEEDGLELAERKRRATESAAKEQEEAAEAIAAAEKEEAEAREAFAVAGREAAEAEAATAVFEKEAAEAAAAMVIAKKEAADVYRAASDLRWAEQDLARLQARPGGQAADEAAIAAAEEAVKAAEETLVREQAEAKAAKEVALREKAEAEEAAANADREMAEAIAAQEAAERERAEADAAKQKAAVEQAEAVAAKQAAARWSALEAGERFNEAVVAASKAATGTGAAVGSGGDDDFVWRRRQELRGWLGLAGSADRSERAKGFRKLLVYTAAASHPVADEAAAEEGRAAGKQYEVAAGLWAVGAVPQIRALLAGEAGAAGDWPWEAGRAALLVLGRAVLAAPLSVELQTWPNWQAAKPSGSSELTEVEPIVAGAGDEAAATAKVAAAGKALAAANLEHGKLVAVLGDVLNGEGSRGAGTWPGHEIEPRAAALLCRLLAPPTDPQAERNQTEEPAAADTSTEICAVAAMSADWLLHPGVATSGVAPLAPLDKAATLSPVEVQLVPWPAGGRAQSARAGSASRQRPRARRRSSLLAEAAGVARPLLSLLRGGDRRGKEAAAAALCNLCNGSAAGRSAVVKLRGATVAARVLQQHKEKSGQPSALLTLLVGLLAALAVEREQQSMLLRARSAELAAALICRGRGFTLPPPTTAATTAATKPATKPTTKPTTPASADSAESAGPGGVPTTTPGAEPEPSAAAGGPEAGPAERLAVQVLWNLSGGVGGQAGAAALRLRERLAKQQWLQPLAERCLVLQHQAELGGDADPATVAAAGRAAALATRLALLLKRLKVNVEEVANERHHGRMISAVAANVELRLEPRRPRTLYLQLPAVTDEAMRSELVLKPPALEGAEASNFTFVDKRHPVMPLVARHASVSLEPDALLDGRWWKVEDDVLAECEAALAAQVEVVPPSRQELVSYGMDIAAQLAAQFNQLRDAMESKKGVLDTTELDAMLGTG